MTTTETVAEAPVARKRDAYNEYWIESVQIAVDEAHAHLTEEQIEYIASSVQAAHENYGMAFYSPPSSDRINAIESEWRAKYNELQKELDKYRENSESAVHRLARLHRDTTVSIGDHGEVTAYNGRSGTL
jgi:hypothetical protein